MTKEKFYSPFKYLLEGMNEGVRGSIEKVKKIPSIFDMEESHVSDEGLKILADPKAREMLNQGLEEGKDEIQIQFSNSKETITLI
ncbi:hypothetical protein [Sediminitomix flava]|uniref:Uncharacterized protein n=1 Tax=Sediminitomix flava TaxID=379075 RepID=A0A315ZA62_SEDFL|nr:hypothetical protein [Sediminitomix flava]PWJ41094.1 hypothetical protein BC781_104369 [Sediminitomix flava]